LGMLFLFLKHFILYKYKFTLLIFLNKNIS
jgi:hypothetical protein